MNRLALEDEISAQPGVVSVAFERDPRGAVLGIRATVADRDARDRIRELVAARVGRPFADERLSVIQHGEGRIRIIEVASSIRRHEASVEVSLAQNGRRSMAAQNTTGYTGSTVRLAAVAALDAVSKLLERSGDLMLEDVATTSLGGETTVIVSLQFRGMRGWRRRYGISGVGDGLPEAAAARAVLDALNRPLK